MNISLARGLTIAAAVAGIHAADAAVVTSLAYGIAVPIPVISSDPNLAASNGPITFGPGITFTSQPSRSYESSVFGYTGTYGFGSGDWAGSPIIGLNVGRGTMTLSFAAPIRGFLAEINSDAYFSSSDAVVTAYDADGTLLDQIIFESQGVKLTPGNYGFAYDTARIARVTFANKFIAIRGLSVAPGIDAATVPEPATWACFVLGFAIAGSAVRRRTAARFEGPAQA